MFRRVTPASGAPAPSATAPDTGDSDVQAPEPGAPDESDANDIFRRGRTLLLQPHQDTQPRKLNRT